MSMSPPITREALLSPISRWTWQMKFWMCEGLYRRTITFEEAKEKHGLSDEELNRWYGLYQTTGATGLQKINRTKNRSRAA
jgi:hypothetical protein